MAIPPSTSYAVGAVTAGTLLTNWTSYVNVSNMPAAWKALVDTSDGTKGRIFLDDGTTRLAMDPVRFDDSGEVIGEFRFLIPTFSGVTPTTVRVYPPVAANASVAAGATYGSDNAYDSSWEMYLPLDEAVNNDPGGYVDRTSNGNDGQGVSMALTEVAGQVGIAQDFDGSVSGDLIDVGDIDEVDHADVSFLFWVKLDVTNIDQDFMSKGSHDINQPILIWFDDAVSGAADVGAGNTETLSVLSYDGSVQHFVGGTDNALENTDWNHCVVVLDNTNNIINIYINGVLDQTSTKSWNGIDANATAIRLAGSTSVGFRLNGQLDEAQIHSVARPPGWIQEEKDQTFDNAVYWGAWTIAEEDVIAPVLPFTTTIEEIEAHQVVAYRPGHTDELVYELISAQPVFLEITTAEVGVETKIEHNLGRVPNGYMIVRTPYKTYQHGHSDTDTPWDDQFMYITFSLAEEKITLAVF